MLNILRVHSEARLYSRRLALILNDHLICWDACTVWDISQHAARRLSSWQRRVRPMIGYCQSALPQIRCNSKFTADNVYIETEPRGYGLITVNE